MEEDDVFGACNSGLYSNFVKAMDKYSNAYLNDQNVQGKTLLMCAVEQNHKDIITELLMRGADDQVSDFSGKTVWDHATPEMIIFLKQIKESM
eukprot:CAMPEP_0168542402 /NCGR_PEP_ID=MMETSP0413-20121227/1329_1 /TAXON_ID=136452 /ORGANISM="Filamoeba nolandi, Strain NC-AS-23-1" /LENGTH=92 /DNA_ID=CAMNT_0008572277 /DNA_START=253 /DNA_END=528 /DNA_ORIENTATION=+